MTNDLVQNLSFRTGFSETKILLIFLNSKKHYYSKTVIKNGKMRNFCIPTEQLKLIQKYIIDLYFSKARISNYAYAYIKNRSIIENVKVHNDSKYFYKTDITNFFPSITSEMIENVLIRELSSLLNIKDIKLIVKLCAPFGHLDLGSPTSPILSNIIMLEFDEELIFELHKIDPNLIYTRYSDDITISSKKPFNLTDNYLIETLLKKYGFYINKKKTQYLELKSNIKITGVYLHKDKSLTVGNKYKNEVSRFLYKILNNKEINITKEQVRGKLSFIKDVEPNYYQKLIIKYQIDEDFFD